MPRWIWFVPLTALITALGLWGFRLGWIAATITETDVIETWSARYVAEDPAQRRVTDCTARPGRVVQVWIVVSCIDKTGERRDYAVNRWGQLLEVTPAPTQPAVPQT